jgi:hypothetical protein
MSKYNTEEMCNITVQHATNKETAELHPVPGSRDATPGSSNMMPYAPAIEDTKRGSKGGKKRRNRCPQWVKVVTDYDDDSDKKADGPNMGYVATAVHSGKH